MKPTPYEAREALLIATANGVADLLADKINAKGGGTNFAARYDSLMTAICDVNARVEPGPGRVPVTFGNLIEHASDCKKIIYLDGECSCGADHDNAERRARSVAILTAIASSMPDNNPRGVERFLLTLHQQGFEVVRRDYANGAEQVAAALACIDEAIPEEFDTTRSTLERARMMRARLHRVTNAVRWALGEGEEEFSPEPPNIPGRIHGKFYWRRDLRARAFG